MSKVQHKDLEDHQDGEDETDEGRVVHFLFFLAFLTIAITFFLLRIQPGPLDFPCRPEDLDAAAMPVEPVEAADDRADDGEGQRHRVLVGGGGVSFAVLWLNDDLVQMKASLIWRKVGRLITKCLSYLHVKSPQRVF